MKVMPVLLSLLVVLTTAEAYVQQGVCSGSDLGTETVEESWECDASGGASCSRIAKTCGCDGYSTEVGGTANYDRRGNPLTAVGEGWDCHSKCRGNPRSSGSQSKTSGKSCNGGGGSSTGNIGSGPINSIVSSCDHDLALRPEVFDADFYLNTHPDLGNAGLHTKQQATTHWCSNGIKEGRQAISSFHSKQYLENYSDLQKAFGDDYGAAIEHYINYGIKEGRGGITALRPEVFDANFYLYTNPDLGNAGLHTKQQATTHWCSYGIKEGRQAISSFHSKQYLENYSDLQKAFGDDYGAAIEHYINYGIKEGRVGITEGGSSN